MKIKVLFFICIILSSIDIADAQKIVTKKTFWDWDRSRLNEIFTVIAGTGTRHGYYKKYDTNGMLLISANYSYGALNGLYIEYFGTPQNYISKSTNYMNGEKNGVEKIYNIGNAGHYLIKKCIYKKDEMTEKTSYYTDAKYKGRKKSHVKLTGDRQFNTNWYPNGQIEYKGVLQVIPGNYGNRTAPIQYIRYNQNGVLMEEFNDNVISFYAEDGKTITQKEDLSTDVIEYYDNGILTKRIKVLKEDGNEYYEISLYKNDSIYSQKTVDYNGTDIELLKKKKQSDLQYDSLYNTLTKIFSSKFTTTNKIQIIYDSPDDVRRYCRKGLYESSMKYSDLTTIIGIHKNNLNKIISQRNEYTHMGAKDEKGKYYKSAEKIKEYINKLNHAIIQEDTLHAMQAITAQIEDDLYYIECSYTYYTSQQGYKDNVPRKHKNAYRAYISTTEHLTSKMKDKNMSETLTMLQQYAIICSKMRKWYNMKINHIEKLFKKTENPEEQIDIFINNDSKQ